MTMQSNALPKIVGLEYLIPITRKSLATLRTDVTRNPESLPPRLMLPGSRKIMFLEDVVIDWVNSFRPVKDVPSKRGRPSGASQ
jgi:hypothetical protein